MIWDGDGEGSLSPDEIMKAFIQLGLSQDYHFANKIMQNIKPRNDDPNAEPVHDILLRDFIKVFKTDDVSENLITVINNEVNLKKRTRIRKVIT